MDFLIWAEIGWVVGSKRTFKWPLLWNVVIPRVLFSVNKDTRGLLLSSKHLQNGVCPLLTPPNVYKLATPLPSYYDFNGYNNPLLFRFLFFFTKFQSPPLP